jgi:hypothetical protein
MIDNNNNNKRKTRRKGKKEGGGGERIKNMKEGTRQRLPEFTAEASLQRITTIQRYHLTREYAQTPIAGISSAAASFLDYLCYCKCMIRCSIICSPPRMCLVSCPQQCRAQCGLFGTI